MQDLVIPYSELTLDKFNARMKENGCLMIKGLFPAEEIEIIKNETLDLFYIIKNLLHNNLIGPAHSKYLAGGHPAGILPHLDSLEHVLNKPAFIECLKSHFKQDNFKICVESTGIRRCDPVHWKNFLPWHQDRFNREDCFLTCWLPLMPIDDKTAGLDLVPRKVNELLGEQDGLDVSYNGKGLTDEIINAKVTSLRWQPKMEVGDVLIFDPYCPHRTSYDPDFKTERYSIDIRIQPAESTPDQTWVTKVISLPSNKSYVKETYESRSMFQFRDLVSLNSEQKNDDANSKKRLIKKFIKRIAGL